MGCVIQIPRIIKREAKTVVILNPLEDLREIIDEYAGMEARDLFDEVVRDQVEEALEPYETGDDYERIADGLNTMCINTMNELEEILSSKRLDRNRLEALWKELKSNL